MCFVKFGLSLKCNFYITDGIGLEPMKPYTDNLLSKQAHYQLCEPSGQNFQSQTLKNILLLTR